MKVLKVENGQEKVINYPRHDNGPIVGLDSKIKFYSIEDNQPVYDKENEFLQFTGYELTTEKNPNLPHLLIARKKWDIVAIQKEKTIEERLKDAEELIIILSKEEKDRTTQDKAKIDEIKNKIETKTLRDATT